MYKIPCQNCKGHGTIEHYKHVENGEYIKADYTINGNGRYIVTIDSGSYFLDTLN